MDFDKLGKQIGELVNKKNAAYGNSFEECAKFLRILFPHGVKPEQYVDLLTITRVFDKLMRIAHKKDAFDESPWQDIVGYGLLATNLDNKSKEENTPHPEPTQELLDLMENGKPIHAMGNDEPVAYVRTKRHAEHPW